MSNAIQGKKREQHNFTKRVGLFTAKVVAINPDTEEYKDVLGIDLKEDSKATEYLGESKDGNTSLRVDVWLEDVKTKQRDKIVFFLEDKERENKDGNKLQYINNIGSCAWADDPNNLPEWFTKREYRVAKVGEEDLYNFIRTWLGNLEYRDAETTLSLEWKKLMKGNINDLKSQINGEWCTNVVALATIKTIIKDDETKEYQGIYNKAFLPEYALKQFRVVDYSNPTIVSGLSAKKSKDLKPYERFVLNVSGEYGCKDYYILKDVREYNPDDNLVASDKVISDENGDY